MKQKALIILLLSIVLLACFSEQANGKTRKQNLTSSTSNSSGKLTITKKKKTSYLKFRDEPQYMIINVDIDWPVSNNGKSITELQKSIIDATFERNTTNIDAIIKEYCTKRSGGKVVTTIPKKVKQQKVPWYQNDLEVKCTQVVGQYATFQIDDNTFNGVHSLPTYRRYVNYDIKNNMIIALNDILDFNINTNDEHYTKLNNEFKELISSLIKQKKHDNLSNYIDYYNLKNVDFTFKNNKIAFTFDDEDEGYFEIDVPKEKLAKFMTDYGRYLLQVDYVDNNDFSLEKVKEEYGLGYSNLLPNDFGNSISFIGPSSQGILLYEGDNTNIKIFKNKHNGHNFKDNKGNIIDAPYVMLIDTKIYSNDNIIVTPLNINNNYVVLSNDNHLVSTFPLYGERSSNSLFSKDGTMLKDITLNSNTMISSSVAFINDVNALYFNGKLYSLSHEIASYGKDIINTKELVGTYDITLGKSDIGSLGDGAEYFTVKMVNGTPFLYLNSNIEWMEIKSNHLSFYNDEGSVGAMDYFLCGDMTYSNGQFKGVMWWRCIVDEDENGKYRYDFSTPFPVVLKKISNDVYESVTNENEDSHYDFDKDISNTTTVKAEATTALISNVFPAGTWETDIPVANDMKPGIMQIIFNPTNNTYKGKLFFKVVEKVEGNQSGINIMMVMSLDASGTYKMANNKIAFNVKDNAIITDGKCTFDNYLIISKAKEDQMTSAIKQQTQSMAPLMKTMFNGTYKISNITENSFNMHIDGQNKTFKKVK